MSQGLNPLRIGLLASLVVLTGCSMEMDTDQRYLSREFTSNGERIYFTGRSLSGQPIVYRGGNMHAQMHTNGCVNCHGENREGGRRMYPFFWVTTPALTASALLGAHGDDHDNHDSYNRDSLKRAISAGITPSGQHLDRAMPRWSLHESDLNDLVDYLIVNQ